MNKICELDHQPEDCVCLEGGNQGHGTTTCGGKITIPSLDEQHILAKIRVIQEEARRIKKDILAVDRLAEGPRADVKTLRNRLEVLRQQRADLENQRVRAAEERMRFLGHA
ncbi:MAG TPA: hypothetical protein DEO88_14765 [Syntrophobacteraceae bacterium]|nr:hypothetical protein [Syntrophobacteraceae bacterium]